jgi:DNA-binding NtrC family response regulator
MEQTENSSYSIFVVDDEQIITLTLSLILKQQGYHASAFHDAQAVLEACENGAPDLLISDIAMPEINGVELAITMQQRFPECRLLLFSGQAKTSIHLEDAWRRGYNFEVQPKPLHPEQLLARVQQILRG